MDPKVLLDELMGKDRDLPLDQQKKKRLKFDDSELHDETLRSEFLESSKVLQYEAEFLVYLERLISDLERKIKRCHERLDKEMPLTDHVRSNSDRISAIAMEVQCLLKQAEKEGEDGEVDHAQASMSKVDDLNKEKDQLARAVMPEFGSILEKEKRMQVCEVCGAMQASTDTEKRLASHLEGKQHLGYFRIRQTAAELRKKKEDRESQKRDRENADMSLENESKFKVKVVAVGDMKDSDKNGFHPEERERYRRQPSRSKDKYRRRCRSPERVRDRAYDGGTKDRGKDRNKNRDHYCSRSRGLDRGRDACRDSERGRARDHDRGGEGSRRPSRNRDHR